MFDKMLFMCYNQFRHRLFTSSPGPPVGPAGVPASPRAADVRRETAHGCQPKGLPARGGAHRQAKKAPFHLEAGEAELSALHLPDPGHCLHRSVYVHAPLRPADRL